MDRVNSALPQIPNEQLVPHIHPEGARCLKCSCWTASPNPNSGDCKYLGRTNSEWGCPLFQRQ